jgi:hypothetical protein
LSRLNKAVDKVQFCVVQMIQSQLPRNRQAHFLKKFGVSGVVVQII